MAKKTYEVIRDKQEKARFWCFANDENCSRVIDESMETGDYGIKGMENIFTIERKGSTGEFANNITEDRFERELARMDKMRYSFLILEFTLDDIYNFPYNSGIPSNKWGKLKITSNFILKRLIEIETDHKVKIIFAGDHGEDVATTIFKRMAQL